MGIGDDRGERVKLRGRRSVRWQLGLLILTVTVPIAGLVAWGGVREYRLLQAAANSRVLALTSGTATAARTFLSGAEELVVGIAEASPESLMDPVECAATLGPMRGVFSYVTNLAVIRSDGSEVCSLRPTQGVVAPGELGLRPWFVQATSAGAFIIGDPRFGTLSRTWVLPLATPIHGADGSIVGILAASIELRRLQELLVESPFGPRDLVTIATSDNVVLARSVDPDQWIGTTLPERTSNEREVAPGRSLAGGTDLMGVARVWGQEEISDLGWWVYAGVPESEVWAPLQSRLQRTRGLSVLVLLLAVLFASAVSRNLAVSLSGLVAGVRGGRDSVRASLPVGAPTEVVAVARAFDEVLRESQEVAEQLRRSQKMEAVGQLAGGVAHDFNNLLTVIQGNVEILLKRLPKDAAGRQEAHEIATAASQAAAVTRQLLTFSRRDRARAEPTVVSVLAMGLETVLSRLMRKDIRFAANITFEPLTVMADRGHLEQVMLNLVLNARDAVGPGGHVTLTVRRSDRPAGAPPGAEDAPGWVVIEVSDDGPGMDAETQARIFEPFFTTKPMGRGTGLGLATVFGIVDQMGWVLNVESAPGEGATFRVWIPTVHALEAARSLEVSPPAPSPSQSGTRTVLLVEDEPALRAVVGRVLARSGLNVLAAADGVQGLEQAKSHPGPIDLVVSDVIMPEMSGPAMAERLEEMRPGLPVLFMTGFSEDPRIAELLRQEPVRVLLKPFTPDELMARVNHFLEGTAAAGR